ncbi:YncE family protein [Alteromonas sp. A081]|uniref:YncE family protein n=1 Tax=Alteromonas sp. A081 TaxID=3410269 RepID=UPI003B9854A8
MKCFSFMLLVFAGFLNSANAVQNQNQYQDERLQSGILAVVNKSDDSISIIDVSEKRIIKTLPTGKGPHELVMSENQKWAVSTDFVGGDSLTVFDLSSLEVARTIPLASMPGPHGATFLNDNERIIFTSGKAKHIGIANVVTGNVTNKIETAQDTTHMVTLNNDESVAYTTNICSNSISVVNMSNQTLLKNMTTLPMPEAINYRKSAEELWYGANKEGRLVVINPDTEQEIAQWQGFSFPYRVLFNHDESVAMVPDFQNHYIRFFDATNKKELGTLALEKEAGPQGITMHPEHNIAFLSLNLKNKIVAIDIHTQQIIAEFPTGNNPDGVIFISR